jgi:hypothetical protein
MLAYRGLSVTAKSLRGKIYIPGKEGSLTTEIVARTRQYQLLPYVLSPSLPDILMEVTAGNPVLVMQNLGFDWFPRWHFSIVTGFDRDKEIVIQRSGNEKALETPFQLFEKTWQRADRWALVITSPDKLPKTAQQSTFIQAALELELVGQTEAAREAYLAARNRWPNAAMAIFGAGNTSYQLKEFAQAARLYGEYVTQTPDSASGWNNLAHSLMQLECPDESIEAIRCALSIDPTNPEYRDSRRELLERRASTSGHEPKSSCAIPRCPTKPSG